MSFFTFVHPSSCSERDTSEMTLSPLCFKNQEPCPSRLKTFAPTSSMYLLLLKSIIHALKTSATGMLAVCTFLLTVVKAMALIKALGHRETLEADE